MPNLFKSNPLIIGLTALVLIVAVIAFFSSQERKQERRDEINVNLGAIQERDKSNAHTINQIQEARDAVEQPSSNELNVVCSRWDRNCQDGQ